MIEAANLPGYEVAPMTAMLAPAGTPKPVIDKLNGEVARVLQLKDVRERFSTMGLAPAEDRSPSRFPGWYEAELSKWTKLIRDAGISPER
ncbi:MAG: hypothetical protein IT529_00495 [Burkholderiales bacterium]|nr:hypothetical protein [Burkholderiales bacterium]